MTSYFHLVVRHAQLILGNKNMKIGIFTCGSSVRSKNIFTNIPRYPTEKHEINRGYLFFFFFFVKDQKFYFIEWLPSVIFSRVAKLCFRVIEYESRDKHTYANLSCTDVCAAEDLHVSISEIFSE